MTRSVVACCVTMLVLSAAIASADPLPGTEPLELQGDIASQLVEGVDRFLLRQLAESVDKRAAYWKRDTASPDAYNASIEPNRARLRHMLGIDEQRVKYEAPTLVATVDRPALIGKGDGFEVYAIAWPVLGDPQSSRGDASLHGAGLLLVPVGRQPVADVVVVPHCEQTPEQLVGLAEGVPPARQTARLLAESGCRVVVPVLINRNDQTRGMNLTRREYLHRSAWELGRTVTGYETQKALAIVDWFASDDAKRPIAVVGYGDGGMIALYAAALDPRIDAAVVSGYFAPRQTIWQTPIDRNVFGLLREFGDAELAAMVWPRTMIVDPGAAPTRQKRGGHGAPFSIETPSLDQVNAEAARARKLLGDASNDTWLRVIATPQAAEPGPSTQSLGAVLTTFAADAKLADKPDAAVKPTAAFNPEMAAERHARQFDEIERHTQLVLVECEPVRDAFMGPLYGVAQSKDLAAYNKLAADYRKKFYDDVIGRFDLELKPFNARTRLVEDNDKWTRYEVTLDVFDDVIAYGLITIPKGIKDGERRPVVVCQHGLEGRPQDTIGQPGHQYYKAFATTLAERGFITFSPQNLYLFNDRFRTLQRKANPLGKTLYSIITPQHQQIVNWLKTQPNVDPARIGFYGLSYGGKTAMRVPALVTDYALSICSADFNEWVWKNTAVDTGSWHWSYVRTVEYEIFEWDLGHTFNYAEMAALIAPRPFMVERGHFDGVAPDRTVAYEYAKIRYLYAALLGLGDRTEIEFFVGPHTINGIGTFDFLHKHLSWPKPTE